MMRIRKRGDFRDLRRLLQHKSRVEPCGWGITGTCVGISSYHMIQNRCCIIQEAYGALVYCALVSWCCSLDELLWSYNTHIIRHPYQTIDEFTCFHMHVYTPPPMEKMKQATSETQGLTWYCCTAVVTNVNFNTSGIEGKKGGAGGCYWLDRVTSTRTAGTYVTIFILQYKCIIWYQGHYSRIGWHEAGVLISTPWALTWLLLYIDMLYHIIYSCIYHRVPG